MTAPRRLACLGAAGLLSLALTGCGAGLDAQTYQTRTVADATNVNIGTLSVRNVAVLPPAGGRTFEAGEDARGTFVVANSGSDPDRLVSLSSASATEVVLLSGGAPTEVEVPGRATTGNTASFILRGLTSDLGTGEIVTITFTFERAGTIDVLVPIQTTGRTDRPAFTGEPGSEEGEPALQGPAGGHGETEGEGEEGGSEAERGAAEEGSTEAGETEPVGEEASQAPEPVEASASPTG